MRVAGRADRHGEVAEHRVVLQQVRERRGVGDVVDRDEVDVLVAERGAHDVAADPSEPVDAYPDGHSRLPSVRLHTPRTGHSIVSASMARCLAAPRTGALYFDDS